MLEDFIEANGLKARVVLGEAKGDQIKCSLFAVNNRGVLAVFLKSNRLNLHKLWALLGEKARPVSESKAMEITGYRKGFLPPISIYGVKVFIDRNVFRKRIVRCLVAEDKTLEISPNEIRDFNDEVEIADITE